MNIRALACYLPLVLSIAGCSIFTEKKTGYVCHVDEIETRLSFCESEFSGDQYTKALQGGLDNVLSHFDAPEYDGGNYEGEILICLSRSGHIDNIMLYKPSGHQGLDAAMMRAAKATDQVIVMPDDKCAADKLYFARMHLVYGDEDMKR